MIVSVGATGLLGGAAVEELCSRGLRVRCLVRNTSETAGLQEKPGVEIVRGSLDDLSFLEKTLENAETVISSFATNITRDPRVSRLWKTDYEGNFNLIRLAQKAGVKKFIFISYWGLVKSDIFEHGKIKKMVEDLLQVSSLDYTVLRVTTLATDMSLLLGGRLKKKGWAPVFMKKNDKIRPILLEDLAWCMAEAISNPRAARTIIEVAGREEYTFDELQELFCKTIGTRVRLVFVPARFACFVASIIDFITKNQFNARGLVSAFTGGSTCDTAEMHTVFNGLQQGSFAQHLSDYFTTGKIIFQKRDPLNEKR